MKKPRKTKQRIRKIKEIKNGPKKTENRGL